jgi:hypothetical protein
MREVALAHAGSNHERNSCHDPPNSRLSRSYKTWNLRDLREFAGER